MKRTIRILALLLAVLSVLSLAACTSGGGESTNTPAASTGTNASTGTSSGSSAVVDPGAAEVERDESLWDENGMPVLPLVDSTVEVLCWKPYTRTNFESMNEFQFFRSLADRTGVLLTWENPSSANGTEAFNLMMASQDYTDVIFGFNTYYQKGGDNAIAEEIALSLNDLVPQYMPNYQRIRQTSTEHMRDTMTDEGNLYAIWGLTIDREAPWLGVVIRSDLVEAVGLTLPETIDEWTTALSTIKSTYGTPAPLELPNVGTFYNNEFTSAYGIGASFYQKNGVVHYGPYEDAFKDYIQQMRDWYAAGLIDHDFTTNGTSQYMANTDMLARNEIIAGALLWGFAADMFPQRSIQVDEGFYLHGVKSPTLNKGDTVQLGMRNTVSKQANVITTDAQNPELICRLFDYLYTDEGSLLLNYGEEGKQWEYDANGNIKMTDAFNEEVLTCGYTSPWETLLFYYAQDNAGGYGLYDYTRLLLQYDDLHVYNTTCMMWDQDGNEETYPSTATMTAEENAAYFAIYSDMNTYVQEHTCKMITGEEDMSAFETMQNQLRAMGVEQCIGYKQAALDRYNAR